MKRNSLPFRFYTCSSISNKKNFITELFFDEHLEEIRQRCFQSLFIVVFFILIAFLEIKDIVKILEVPVQNVRFFPIITWGIFFINIKNFFLYRFDF